MRRAFIRALGVSPGEYRRRFRPAQPAAMIEYDPQPPYDAGSPDRAPAQVVRTLRARSRFLLTGRPG